MNAAATNEMVADQEAWTIELWQPKLKITEGAFHDGNSGQFGQQNPHIIHVSKYVEKLFGSMKLQSSSKF
jgi:hypothetical protein